MGLNSVMNAFEVCVCVGDLGGKGADIGMIHVVWGCLHGMVARRESLTVHAGHSPDFVILTNSATDP